MKKFVTTSYYISSEKVDGRYKIAFLSDLHNSRFGEKQRELIEAIEAEKVDIILFGGDMVSVKEYIAFDLSPLEDILRAFAGKIPMLYAYGNHEQRMRISGELYKKDWYEFKSLLKKYHVPLLFNKTVKVGKNIAVSGIRIPGYFYEKRLCFNNYRPYRKWERVRYVKGENWVCNNLPNMDNNNYNILLAHTPLCMNTYWEAGADLALSGHYHGGIARLPRGRGLISPQFKLFARMCWGIHRYGTKTGIVSAGLGQHSGMIRLRNPEELVIIQIN